MQLLFGPFLDHCDFVTKLPAMMKIIKAVLLPAEANFGHTTVLGILNSYALSWRHVGLWAINKKFYI